MIKDFLHKLNEDCSNIDEVYSQLLKKYNPDNITKTEITFIDSIQYDKVKNNSNKISVISNYLGKKNSKGKMYDIDYYNHYINYKRFCFEVVRKQYDKNEFEDVVNRLDKYLSRYQYIFNRLENIKKVEFKQDTIDHLKNISEQEHSKYEIVFTDSLKRIENDFFLMVAADGAGLAAIPWERGERGRSEKPETKTDEHENTVNKKKLET
jgi:hypothetical protein